MVQVFHETLARTVAKLRSLSNYRANATSESVVHDYFERLDHALTKYDPKPNCVYSVDEKGIQTEHSPHILSVHNSIW